MQDHLITLHWVIMCCGWTGDRASVVLIQRTSSG